MVHDALILRYRNDDDLSLTGTLGIMRRSIVKVGIQAKLFGGFGAVLLLLAIVGYIGWNNTVTFSSSFKSMYVDRLQPVVQLGAAAQGLYELRAAGLQYGAVDALGRAKLKAADDKWLKQIDDRMKAYAATLLVPEERQWLKAWDQTYPAYVQTRQKFLLLYEQGVIGQADTVRDGAAAQLFGKADEAIDRLIDVQERVGAEMNRDLSATADASTKMLLGAIFLAILVGLAVAFLLARGIAGGLASVVATAKVIASADLSALAKEAGAIAQGDLTGSLSISAEEVSIKSGDEVGDLAQAFNLMIAKLKETGIAFGQMTEGLREIVGGVVSTAENLAASSDQLSQAASQAGAATQQISTTIQQMAKGAQSQAASAQGASGSIQQLTQAIDQVAKGAQEQSQAIQETSSTVAKMSTVIDRVSTGSQVVASSAGKAEDAAKGGATAVNHAMEGMGSIRQKVSVSAQRVRELGDQSEQIGRIVEAIDDIAEQTNLLALNAAIEAARAGEHGKGFAVVADEVRKLAERSALATKENSRIIVTVQKGTGEAVVAMGEVAKEVEAGSKLSAEAGKALNDILGAVQETSGRMRDIAMAVSEMNAHSSEVVRSVESVSAVVEENTAATEEMAAGASEVAQGIDSVARVSEENAASVEEISAGTEEVSAQMEEVVASAESLSRMAEDLREVVSRFKLGDESTQSDLFQRRRKSDWGKPEPLKGTKLAFHRRPA